MPGPSKKKGQKAKQQRAAATAAATAAAAAAAPPSVVNDFELPAREWLEKKMRDAGVGPETMTDEERAAFEAKVAQLEAEQAAAEESTDSRSAWYQRHEAASSNKQQKNTISIGEYDPVEACAALPPEKRTAWTEAYLEGKVLFIVACFPYSALRKKHRALTTRFSSPSAFLRFNSSSFSASLAGYTAAQLVEEAGAAAARSPHSSGKTDSATAALHGCEHNVHACSALVKAVLLLTDARARLTGAIIRDIPGSNMSTHVTVDCWAPGDARRRGSYGLAKGQPMLRCLDAASFVTILADGLRMHFASGAGGRGSGCHGLDRRIVHELEAQGLFTSIQALGFIITLTSLHSFVVPEPDAPGHILPRKVIPARRG